MGDHNNATLTAHILYTCMFSPSHRCVLIFSLLSQSSSYLMAFSCLPPPSLPLNCLLSLFHPCCTLPPSVPDPPLPVVHRMVSGARLQDFIFSLSGLSAPLFLSFLPSIPLSVSLPSHYCSGLICRRGLAARQQDFHITSSSLPEDLQLFLPLASSTIHQQICFVKLLDEK